MGHRSPSIDSNAASLVLDPELFVHSRNGSRLSANGAISGIDDSYHSESRSHRGSCDQAVFAEADSDYPAEETGGFRNLNLGDSGPKVDRRASKQGMKRRALSPPSDMVRDDKVSTHPADLYHKINTSVFPRSPAAKYQSKHGSVSSASSSARHNSYASSAAFSAAASSMTSISSFERQSPSDFAHHFSPAQGALSPATSLAAARKSQPGPQGIKTTARKASAQLSPKDAKLSPAMRVGNRFICECCPKKPKRFDTEDELR